MKKPPSIVIISVIIVLVAFGFLSTIDSHDPWSKINCWTWEIDINSGKKRYKRYIAYKVTEERIEETWISKAVESDKKENWKLVLTLSPGVNHSPHYIFHSAISDLKQFEMMLGLCDKNNDIDYDPEILSIIANNVILLWNRYNGDSEAGDYIIEVISKWSDYYTVEDLPNFEAFTEMIDQQDAGG
tara:strand:- start:38 stop:595 length:558 start_codon:yes stop_codon:yes gene_type:complete